MRSTFSCADTIDKGYLPELAFRNGHYNFPSISIDLPIKDFNWRSLTIKIQVDVIGKGFDIYDFLI